MNSRFTLQTAFDVDYAPATIKKWRSTKTGLQLTYINQPSPMVNGYFAVATEIPNDSGCPHTLEHLIFMGSKKYPYKGLLDTLGQRFFSYTNAWTAIDRTVYTLTTAGWEGFRTLLPVYLDHIFNPTITDDACLTEVYHVDGKGKEKGVVFSEMQGIESQSWFILYLNMYRSLYARDSGYSSETGGLMSELRHLTNDQIRQFHREMYRPDNVCVIVTGSVDEDELLSTMSKLDETLPSLPTEPSRRPFVDSELDLPLKEMVVKEVEFPDEDESMGELLIGWIGPPADQTIKVLALDMIGAYFCESPISLFNKNIVEIENPLATDIDVVTDDFIRLGINFYVGGISVSELHKVDSKIKDLILESTKEENFDLDYMREIVSQQRIKYISKTEDSPSTFSNVAISEFVYGKPDGSDLSKWLKSLREQDELKTWTAKQWCDLIKETFVESKPVTIIGKPSAKANKEHKELNKKRDQELQATLGETGLAERQARLDEAQSKNDSEIPEDVLTQFGKPDASLINFIHVKSYKAGKNESAAPYYEENDAFAQALRDDTPNDFPLYLHFEDYKSQFVTAQLVFSTTAVPVHLLRYFSVMEDVFSLSIKTSDGEYIPYETVISSLNNILLDYELDNGFESQCTEVITVSAKFEVSKFEEAINWLINVLKYSVFEESRIKIIVEKLINSLPDKKRNDELMMYSSEFRNIYTERSLKKSQDSIYTEQFYKDILQKIDDGKFSEIESDLNEIRNSLFNNNNMKIFLIGGCSNLINPVSSWSRLAKEFENSAGSVFDLDKLPRSFQFKSEIGNKCSGQAFLVTTPASETTHLISLTPIPTDYAHEDIPKIALACEVLCAMEGPLWRGIRGSGLAYDANIKRMVESGFLSFTIYRGADAQQAWSITKRIIHDYVHANTTIDKMAIDNAVAGLVNQLAKAESNNYDAATNRILDNVFKKRGPNYVQSFLQKLEKVTQEDIRYVLSKYFVRLFAADSSVIFSCLPTTIVSDFKSFLSSQNYNVQLEEINASVENESDGMDESDDMEDEDDDSDSEDEA